MQTSVKRKMLGQKSFMLLNKMHYFLFVRDMEPYFYHG